MGVQGSYAVHNHVKQTLVTNRLGAVVALGLTAYVFALAVKGTLHLGRTASGWLLPLDFLLHGWALQAANIAFYGWLCWAAVSFLRATRGPERVLVAGWCANILLAPLEVLLPSWRMAIRYAGTFGLGVALIAALLLLIRFVSPADSADRADGRSCNNDM